MQGRRSAQGGFRAPRIRLAETLYAVLLVAGVLALLRVGPPHGHLLAIASLTAVALGGQLASHQIRTRVAHQFDMDLGLVLVAVVLAGPLAGVAVVVIPELLVLVRRRQAPWRLWAIANWVSMIATALAGGFVLALLPAGGPLDGPRLFLAGIAMLLANYVFARLILAVARERARPLELLRTELWGLLPLELVAIAVGTVSALLIPVIGLLALVGFALLVYLPQLAIAQLLRAPSVARLSVDEAARVYRDALADELGVQGSERRILHTVDALVQRRPLSDPPEDPRTTTMDALLVSICTSRPPTQRGFSAPERVQIVLVARRWAELTARLTPALSHHEAMSELRGSGIAQDAPSALAAAARIAERERPLSEHIAGLPRLYLLPLPRAVRRGVLPLALARLVS